MMHLLAYIYIHIACAFDGRDLMSSNADIPSTVDDGITAQNIRFSFLQQQSSHLDPESDDSTDPESDYSTVPLTSSMHANDDQILAMHTSWLKEHMVSPDYQRCPLAKPDCSFKMENGKPVLCNLESVSHYQYAKWIRPSDVVLELGARYGQTTCMLKKLTEGKGEVIAVEPDKHVWPAIEHNLKTHGCETQLVKGVIGKPKQITVRCGPNKSPEKCYHVETGKGAAGGTNNATRIDGLAYKDLSILTGGKKVTVLAVDCEGCFKDFKRENPQALQDAELLIIEDHNPSEHAAVTELLAEGWKVLDGSDIDKVPSNGDLNAYVLSRRDRKPANSACDPKPAKSKKDPTKNPADEGESWPKRKDWKFDPITGKPL